MGGTVNKSKTVAVEEARCRSYFRLCLVCLYATAMNLSPDRHRSSSPVYPAPDEIYAANHGGLTLEQQTLRWFREHVTPSLCNAHKYSTSANGLQSITVDVQSFSMPTLCLEKVARQEVATKMPGFRIAQLSVTPTYATSSVSNFRLRLVEHVTTRFGPD